MKKLLLQFDPKYAAFLETENGKQYLYTAEEMFRLAHRYNEAPNEAIGTVVMIKMYEMETKFYHHLYQLQQACGNNEETEKFSSAIQNHFFNQFDF